MVSAFSNTEKHLVSAGIDRLNDQELCYVQHGESIDLSRSAIPQNLG